MSPLRRSKNRRNAANEYYVDVPDQDLEHDISTSNQGNRTLGLDDNHTELVDGSSFRDDIGEDSMQDSEEGEPRMYAKVSKFE